MRYFAASFWCSRALVGITDVSFKIFVVLEQKIIRSGSNKSKLLLKPNKFLEKKIANHIRVSEANYDFCTLNCSIDIKVNFDF